MTKINSVLMASQQTPRCGVCKDSGTVLDYDSVGEYSALCRSCLGKKPADAEWHLARQPHLEASLLRSDTIPVSFDVNRGQRDGDPQEDCMVWVAVKYLEEESFRIPLDAKGNPSSTDAVIFATHYGGKYGLIPRTEARWARCDSNGVILGEYIDQCCLEGERCHEMAAARVLDALRSGKLKH